MRELKQLLFPMLGGMVDHSSPESRKDCATAVAGFLSDMESPPSVHNKVACDLHKRREKAGIPKHIVPWDFDKTPSGTLHKLGQSASWLPTVKLSR